MVLPRAPEKSVCRSVLPRPYLYIYYASVIVCLFVCVSSTLLFFVRFSSIVIWVTCVSCVIGGGVYANTRLVALSISVISGVVFQDKITGRVTISLTT